MNPEAHLIGRIIAIGPNSFLATLPSGEHWIPFSQLAGDFSHWKKGETHFFEIPKWLQDKKGIVAETLYRKKSHNDDLPKRVQGQSATDRVNAINEQAAKPVEKPF